MFEEFLTNKDSWLSGERKISPIVFSSRLRLARNIGDYPFPSRSTAAQKIEVMKTVQEACRRLDILEHSCFTPMSEMSDLDKQFLLERHIISNEHMSANPGKGLIVSSDEKISVMINEEDHLRIQVVSAGFNLQDCWATINEIDDYISGQVPFAFLPDLGYLTTCPTNTGTALRVSCMLHLPALIVTKRIHKILELLTKISFTARGLFGEGTQALGDFFQISNQVSLGVSEQEVIDNLAGVVNQVKVQELDARDTLLKKYHLSLEDSVFRALGALRYCRSISTNEALSHLSMLSLGVDLGIIESDNFIDSQNISKIIRSLFVSIQPAHLQKIEGKMLKEKERDRLRAELLREQLA